MEPALVKASQSARHRNAVMLCCDAGFLPFAAMAVESIHRTVHPRDFDICICSTEELKLPDSLSHLDVRMCLLDVGDIFDGFKVDGRFTITTYLRLALAEVFAAEYDRIVYLDSDILVSGSRLSELFSADLGGLALGAVRDVQQWFNPARKTADQRLMNRHWTYFNSGGLLIDTVKFRQDRIRQACLETGSEAIATATFHDQTILNLVMEGKWAELHPAWNWQGGLRRSLFESWVDVQIFHFIGPIKPWNDRRGGYARRHSHYAVDLIKTHFPERSDVGYPDSVPLEKGRVLRNLFKHMTRANSMIRYLNRFASLMDVKHPAP